METIFPSVVSEGLLAGDHSESAAVFPKTQLSQQPSTDFGCRALQMQKRRLLVLIFTGCEQHEVPSELSDVRFSAAGKYECESKLKPELMLFSHTTTLRTSNPVIAQRFLF